MSAADLRRLIQRATPRIEDVRSPDRTDFVRREHGHLTLREIVDALDALEFSADSFVAQMREVAAEGVAETAVSVLFRAMDGLCTVSQALFLPEPPALADELEGGDPQPDLAADARAKGAERFKAGDFEGAAEQYGVALRAAPRDHALHSNRSAALLKLGRAEEALVDARRCAVLAPEWPKAHFRVGCCWRELRNFGQAVCAFRRGAELEPANKDWERELRRTEALQWEDPGALARQLLLRLMPELLSAWVRGGSGNDSVLQLQVNAELRDAGPAKWWLLREGRQEPKVQIRYAILGRKEHLTNLAANLQGPPEGVAVAGLDGQPLRIPEVSAFLSSGSSSARVHLDVRNGSGKMAGLICRIPHDENLGQYLGARKDPAAPKGTVEAVLQIQRSSGFPKALPRLLGFQAFPGDLNFPVIDLERDAPRSS